MLSVGNSTGAKGEAIALLSLWKRSPEEVASSVAALTTLAVTFGTSSASKGSEEAIVELLEATRAMLQAKNARTTSLH